ncbi:MAG: type II toxin-antitoxin system VapC family toxin [Candidatus Nanoarchaeia archaeon]
MKLYLDTNIYLDFFLGRAKSAYAEKIFTQTVYCRHQIIISDHLLVELTRNLDYKKARTLFEILKPKLIKVTLEQKDRTEAQKLETHYEDALHVVLAKKGGAELIITNNIKDFSSIFNSKRPEDL